MTRKQLEAELANLIAMQWTAHALGEAENAAYAQQRIRQVCGAYAIQRWGTDCFPVATPPPVIANLSAEYAAFVDAPSADARRRQAVRLAGQAVDRLEATAAAAGMVRVDGPKTKEPKAAKPPKPPRVVQNHYHAPTYRGAPPMNAKEAFILLAVCGLPWLLLFWWGGALR